SPAAVSYPSVGVTSTQFCAGHRALGRLQIDCCHRRVVLQSKGQYGCRKESVMAEDLSFRDLIRRVRAGDQRAAAELVRKSEEAIHVVVRLRLTARGLRLARSRLRKGLVRGGTDRTKQLSVRGRERRLTRRLPLMAVGTHESGHGPLPGQGLGKWNYRPTRRD